VDVGEEEGAHMPAEPEARWQVIPGFRHGREGSGFGLQAYDRPGGRSGE
jgi:hypothetical protein